MHLFGKIEIGNIFYFKTKSRKLEVSNIAKDNVKWKSVIKNPYYIKIEKN